MSPKTLALISLCLFLCSCKIQLVAKGVCYICDEDTTLPVTPCGGKIAEWRSQCFFADDEEEKYEQGADWLSLDIQNEVCSEACGTGPDLPDGDYPCLQPIPKDDGSQPDETHYAIPCSK